MERSQVTKEVGPAVSLFDLYFAWVKETESPAVFHRWSLIASVGAMLGRQVWLQFGDSRLFPNMYVMMVGDPGTRKSTAIKRAAKLIKRAGYDTFAGNRTSKEKFLIDLSGEVHEPGGESDFAKAKRSNKDADTITILKSLNLPGGSGSSDTSNSVPREVFIAADEFNNFIGTGNIDFQSLLGELWDWDDPDLPYTQKFKNSRDVSVYQPTVSILGGNTPQGFAACFPLESIGQGFMSRLLLVYGQDTGKRITFPVTPSEEETAELVRMLLEIRSKVVGAVTLHPNARNLLDTIYKNWPHMEDSRFKHYSTRRFTHLLKLCIVCAAMRVSTHVTEDDVYLANTLLSHIEGMMPKAVGELGRSKNAEAANKIMQVLYDAKRPMSAKDLWPTVSNDLDKFTSMGELLAGLQAAQKIMYVKTGEAEGFLANQQSGTRKVLFVRWELLKGKER